MTAKTPKPITNLIDSERTFAGACLLEPERVSKIARQKGMTADSFTDGVARRVFASVLRFVDAGTPCEPPGVVSDTGLEVGIIQKLVDDCPTAAHAEFHADVIQGAALKRNAISAINQADGATAIRLACEKVMQTLPTDQSGAGALTASDWLGEPDAPEYPIAAGLIDAGDRVSIVGQSKARKSFFAMQLAVALATGCPFLLYPVERKRVLLVNGEIRPEPYKKRLRRMIEALRVGTDQLNGLIVVNSCDTESQTLEDVLSLAKQHHAEVVILDPFYLMLGDEIQQVEVKAVVRIMKKFAASGITLIAVFHAAKGRMGDKQVIDRISGSGVFARDATTIISLAEHVSEPDHAVMQCVTRNHPPQDAVTLAFADGAFSVADDIAAVEKTSQTKAVRAISIEDLRQCFKDMPPLPYADTITRVRSRLAIGIVAAKTEIARAVNEDIITSFRLGRQTIYTSKGDMV